MTKKHLLAVVGILAGALLLLVLLGFGNAWLQRRQILTYNLLPEIAYEAIVSDPALQIFSLHPEKEQDSADTSLFNGYRILGVATCSRLTSRESVVNDLTAC